jgi:hypothetical protein
MASLDADLEDRQTPLAAPQREIPLVDIQVGQPLERVVRVNPISAVMATDIRETSGRGS